MIVFGLTLISFFAHIIFRFRYRYSWHRISVGVNQYTFYLKMNNFRILLDWLSMYYLCMCAIGISVVVAVSKERSFA